MDEGEIEIGDVECEDDVTACVSLSFDDARIVDLIYRWHNGDCFDVSMDRMCEWIVRHEVQQWRRKVERRQRRAERPRRTRGGRA